MTKPHTTLSEAVRAMNRAKLLPVWDDINHKLHAELDIIFKALDAAALVEQHEAQEPFGPIVAYASSSEFRRNQLLSKAQYDNCLPKNRVDFDIPLVAVSKCDMCNDNGSVGFPPDDYYPCPKCTPPTLAATQAGDAESTTAADAGGRGAAVEAIEFALESDDGDGFLRNWFNGEFDVCRREWPEAPDAVYIGADPLFRPPTTTRSE